MCWGQMISIFVRYGGKTERERGEVDVAAIGQRPKSWLKNLIGNVTF